MPLLVIPPFKLLKGDVLIVILLLLGIVWAADLSLFILSFIRLWNVPMFIGEEGISAKKKTIYWNDVKTVKLTRKCKSKYGYLYERIIITTIDGLEFRFEPTPIICKCIYDVCANSGFIRQFNDCFDNAN
ncbi:MAG: hypothetical protein IJS37_00045 [Bacilli bacterium]|nr:hypothetical protein [Bacilli bacterium]